MDFDYIIYHKNCLDGFSGFFLFMKTNLYIDNPMIYPDQPSTKDYPPNIDNKNIIIIDVAYKKDVLENIIKRAKFVLHIDHHITIRNDVITLMNQYKNFKSVYDNEECGCSLVWIYFKKYLSGFTYNDQMPIFIKYVKDNDIGDWKYKQTLPFITAVKVHYYLDPSRSTLKQWDELFDKSEVIQLIKLGTIYNNYERYLLEQNYRRYTIESFPSEKLFSENQSYFEKPGQYKVAVINGSGCPSASSITQKILDEIDVDFCILWTLHLDKKEYILSFRSLEVDVGQIAKMFNGGGHTLAAAGSFSVKKYDITELFFPESLPRK